ncbi:hypothetical protein I7I53_09104 [Histoplasma capsulatum var. duboisii H88]|uniref:Uncharacterized protein n=1 Tax=Ajellomyces capsulatus (strain H88) TaxID=544711 RepID=A0A8A1L5J3_AJEC8|nr:hypothetical protein I7I53_09104 [Histoplasma capsulatum var. duboisii H88]
MTIKELVFPVSSAICQGRNFISPTMNAVEPDAWLNRAFSFDMVAAPLSPPFFQHNCITI